MDRCEPARSRPQDSRSDLDAVKIHSLCFNDVGVPLPLHISLSRPGLCSPRTRSRCLSTAIQAAVRRAAVGAFELRCAGVEWHRSEESKRSFLSLACASKAEIRPNRELKELLRRAQRRGQAFRQPELYQWASDGPDPSGRQRGARRGGRRWPQGRGLRRAERWEEPGEEGRGTCLPHLDRLDARRGHGKRLKSRTQEIFGSSDSKARLRDIRIDVTAIKAKDRGIR